MNTVFITGSAPAANDRRMDEGITITQCRVIACRCGATGEAAWAPRAASGRPTGLPLSVSAGFYFHESASGTRIACERCQQVVTPGYALG